MDNNVINPQQPNEQNSQPEPQQASADQNAVYSPVAVPVQQDSKNILKNKKILIAAGAGIAVVLVLLIVALVFGGSGKPPAAPENSQSTENTLLEPARAIDIEQINNSISQDISNMNDDSQLPASRIDDKTLGL